MNKDNYWKLKKGTHKMHIEIGGQEFVLGASF